jgi:DNA-binding MarR family transcriptional regulator
MQVDMFFPEPVARNTDPDTSHDAAKDATFSASKHRRLALFALYDHGPLTDYELADVTGLQQNSIGKRRGDCAWAGLVEKFVIAGVVQKRPAPSGSLSIVWTLTPKGEKVTLKLTAMEMQTNV